MTIEKEIKQIVAALSQAHSLKIKVDEHVTSVVKRYIIADHRHNVGSRFSDHAGNEFHWKIYADGSVEGSWEFRWEKGGIAGGHVDIPLEYLWDESALVAFENKRAVEKQELKEKAKKKADLADREKFRELKEKLGPETVAELQS